MKKLFAGILFLAIAGSTVWVVNDYHEQKEYMEIMARRERALDEENKLREQIEKDLDVSTLSNQPGVIRYTREIPKD
jgi:hypothetical protein